MSEQNQELVMDPMPAPSDKYIAAAEAKSLEFMNPKRWQVMNVMAQTFLQSNALPATIKNAPQLIMVMQAGYEAGLQPLESLNAFYFVNGKLSMYGDTAISQVRKAGHSIKWGECNATTATVTITRGDNKESLTSTFTMAMAEQRGLTSNPVYKKYPENMLRFKAFHMTAKFVCPDALHGVPIKEDIEGDIVDEEGNDAKPPVGTKATRTTGTVDTVATHKPLDEALKEEPKEENNTDQPEKPSAKIKKHMKKDALPEKVDENDGVLITPPFTLTGDEKKDSAVYSAIIDDEINGATLQPVALQFLRDYRKMYPVQE